MTERRKLFGAVAGAVRELARKPVPHNPWPRPPGALEPADFLDKCTRCTDCVEACPHGAIGRIPGEGTWGGTPALNPNKTPCQLCSDLPCVAACTTGALVPVPIEAIFFGLAVIDPSRCFVWQGPECGACKPPCPVNAVSLVANKPVIDDDVCNGCGMCANACPVWGGAIEVQL